ncbi:MAG: hypothetical protein ACM3N9_02430 [Syntrophothermus sp.]
MPDSEKGLTNFYYIKILFFSILTFSIFHALGVHAREKSRKEEKAEINFTTRVDSIDLSFAGRYAPILHFHPNEGKQCCYPSSAEVAYSRAKIGRTGKLKAPKVLDPGAPCYYEALRTMNGFRIKYWFWYNYNDYPSGPDLWGSHPGDWEFLEIYFEHNKPVRYHFSNHNGFRSRALNELTFSGDRVEVWVGSGSHANYESEHPVKISSVLGFSDKVAGGGQTWNTGASLVDIRNTIFWKENYTGDWGDGKKIFGPISRTSD